MSEHATIGILNDDLSVSSIYLHLDGHIAHAGSILFKHYNTKERVQQLIDQGYMLSIDEPINLPNKNKQSLENEQYDNCVFYHRDRSDTLSIEKTVDENHFLFENKNKYAYLFKNDKWYTNLERTDFTELETVLRDHHLLKKPETQQPQMLNIVGTIIEKPQSEVIGDTGTTEVLINISGLVVFDLVMKHAVERFTLYRQLNKNDTVAAVVYKGQTNNKWYMKNIERLNF